MNTQQRKTSFIGPARMFGWSAWAALLVCAAPSAAAQSTDHERFSLSLGVFLTDWDSRAQLNGEVSSSGTPVDLENELGFDRSDSAFRIDGYFRFTERSRLDFSAFDLSRKASKLLERDIEWNGETYPVDIQVDAKLDLTIYKTAFTWSLVQRDSGYLGVSAGLYIADIGTGLSAESIGQASSRSVTAPLPVIGLRGQYDLSERWSLRGSAEVFAVDYDAYTGSLYDMYASLDYRFSKQVALGVGFNSVNFNLGVDKTGFDGNLDWRYDGGLLFFKFDF